MTRILFLNLDTAISNNHPPIEYLATTKYRTHFHAVTTLLFKLSDGRIIRLANTAYTQNHLIT